MVKEHYFVDPLSPIRAKKNPGKFQIGDRVRLKDGGWRGVEGVIIEDYGNIGVNRRRYYTVHLEMEDSPRMPFPEEELELVPK